MRDPFLIEGPAHISFSGGRTSGYMLRRVLDAGLQPDVHVLYANTGKEREETLEFVRECGERWRVPIQWVEYRAKSDNPAGFAEVDFTTASRDGEPFAALIRERKYLPNPVTRFCTIELKIRAMKRWMMAQGYEHWTDIIGFRADEPRRVAKTRTLLEDLSQQELDFDDLAPAKKRRSRSNHERFDCAYPLYAAGVTLRDVQEFWAAQPFDLRLQPHEGNCDLCFLKGQAKKLAIIREDPSRAEWWQAREREMAAGFRAHGPDYSQLVQIAARPDLFDLTSDVDDQMDCFCG